MKMLGLFLSALFIFSSASAVAGFKMRSFYCKNDKPGTSLPTLIEVFRDIDAMAGRPPNPEDVFVVLSAPSDTGSDGAMKIGDMAKASRTQIGSGVDFTFDIDLSQMGARLVLDASFSTSRSVTGQFIFQGKQYDYQCFDSLK